MNILFLLRLWPEYGGGETVTRTLANEFVSRGHEVHVLFYKRSFCGQNPFVDERIVEHYIETVHCDEFSCREEDSSEASRAICRIINDYSIDIVINQWNPLSYIKDIKDNTKAKLIWCKHILFLTQYKKPDFSERQRWIKHTLFPVHYKKRHLKHLVNTVDEILPYVDNYIFLSEGDVHNYFKNKGITFCNKIDAIANPIVIDRTFTVSAADKTDMVLVVGRMLENNKKYSRVLKVWDRVEKTKDAELEKYNLHFVGDGPDLPMYKEIAGNRNLQRVTFDGWQNPMDFFKKAKYILVTSDIEGFGMVIVEAQSMGVIPIVMDSFPACHDIIEQGGNGVLIRQGDVRAMYKQLSKLIHNIEEERIAMSERCIASSRRFSVEIIADKWEQKFNQIMGQSNFSTK